jgi:plasmid stability protein
METKTINLRDLPDDLVRKAKACAALHGMTLRDFVLRAIESALQEDLPTSVGIPMAATIRSESKRRTRKG